VAREVGKGGLSWPLAGTGVLLLLIVSSLCFVALVGTETGQAAPLPLSRSAPVEQVGSMEARLVTHTVFVPLAVHAEPIVPNVWRGEYYANDTLSGDPEYTSEDVRVDFDWGDDGAPPGLPADHFSIRWVGQWDFEAGECRG
jgi:hypothetical protein